MNNRTYQRFGNQVVSTIELQDTGLYDAGLKDTGPGFRGSAYPNRVFRSTLKYRHLGISNMPAKYLLAFMKEAIVEARKGLESGGIPIGSVLVIDDEIVGRGHNQRVQKGDPILHAEMDCLRNAGRLNATQYARATLYSTLSPCDMCSGASLLYGIPRIVIGENQTFRGPESYVQQRGVELIHVNSDECIQLMRDFIADQPQLWNEDIGE